MNNYDQLAKERQEKLLQGMMPSHRFVEKPMMMSMMPGIKEKKILMLGCGTGEESDFIKEFGASPENMIGIDLSAKSIELAKQTYSNIEFKVADMMELPFEENTFDFVYSSLAVHYSPNPLKVYEEVYRVLKKEGTFLFSLAHPIRWASSQQEIDGKMYRVTGCSIDDKESEVFGNYNTFQSFVHKQFAWGIHEELSFYVGPPSYHFKLLKKANFSVLDFTESQAVEETKNVDINYYIKNKELPQFMAFLVQK